MQHYVLLVFILLFTTKSISSNLLVSISLVKLLLVMYRVKKVRLNNTDDSTTTQTNLTCQPLMSTKYTQDIL